MRQIASVVKFKGKKFDKLDLANSALCTVFNGSILRNQVNASCAGRASFTPNLKYNLCSFLQVSIVTQTNPCRGTLQSICHKLLKQCLVIIYGVSL